MKKGKIIIIVICFVAILAIVLLVNKTMFEESKQEKLIDNKTSSNLIESETQSSITEAYNIVNSSDDNTITYPISLDYSIKNVTIEIVEDTLTRDSADIIITDNNEEKFVYGTDFKVQKKDGDEWFDLEYLPNTAFNSIAYQMNGNTLELSINFKQYYGSLENGIYKLSKTIYSNEERYEIYSNEFEIK